MAAALKDLSHEEKVAVYMLGVLKDLTTKGLHKTTPANPLTTTGLALFKELKESGFKPMASEASQVIK